MLIKLEITKCYESFIQAFRISIKIVADNIKKADYIESLLHIFSHKSLMQKICHMNIANKNVNRLQ